MSRVQMLRAVVEQRLTEAAEEIFGLFERTISEYEEEIYRQRRLLEDVVKPEIQINKADVPKLLVSKEDVLPEQQQWSPSLDQENPETPHIKEEQEELWTSQEGEQLHGLEEADITKFPFTPLPVKSEDDEEEPQSSWLHQSQTASTSTDLMKPEADGDCGGSEPASNLVISLASGLQPASADQLLSSHCSEPEPQTEDSGDYSNETRERQSGLNTLRNNKVLLGDKRSHTVEKHFICSVCGKTFCLSKQLKRHMKSHSEKKPFSCPVCAQGFHQKVNMHVHMRSHTGEKPFSCSVCGKRFRRSGHLKIHMRSHTGEKPFSCSFCAKTFRRSEHLQTHMRIHTGEKPFSCSVCNTSFARKASLVKHMKNHPGENL